MADAKLTPAQILQRRRSKEYMEAVDAIYSFLHEIVPEPGTPLEDAIKYFLGCEEESKTESGAEIAARLFTIVQSAKANGLIPE